MSILINRSQIESGKIYDREYEIWIPETWASSIANIIERKYDFSASVLSLGLIAEPLKNTRDGILPIIRGRTSEAPLPTNRGTCESRMKAQVL